MISPSDTTAIHEITIANQAGTRASKNIGRASMAAAFEINNVQSRRWCYFNIGAIALAASFLDFEQVSPSMIISNSRSSIDRYPTVNPEQIPAKQAKKNDIPK